MYFDRRSILRALLGETRTSSLIIGALALTVTLWIATIALAEQLEGVGTGYWNQQQTLTGQTSACITIVGIATCALFPAGTSADHLKKVVVINASTPARCAWVMEDAATLSAMSVTDAGDPAAANGFGGLVFTATRHDGQGSISRETLVNTLAGGSREGLCSVSVVSAGDTCYAPCDADNDCTAYGGGTCVAAPSGEQKSRACVFVVCQDDGADSVISISKELVKSQ